MGALEKKERVTTTTTTTISAITQITLTKHIMCLIDFCVVLCKCVFGNSVSHKYFRSFPLSRAPSLSFSPFRLTRQSSISFFFIRSLVRLFLLFLGPLLCVRVCVRVLPVCRFVQFLCQFVRVRCRYECSKGIRVCIFAVDVFSIGFKVSLVVSACLFIRRCRCRRRSSVFFVVVALATKLDMQWQLAPFTLWIRQLFVIFFSSSSSFGLFVLFAEAYPMCVSVFAFMLCVRFMHEIHSNSNVFEEPVD